MKIISTVPEVVDTAVVPRHPSPNFTWTALERGALLAFGAQQREAGYRAGVEDQTKYVMENMSHYRALATRQPVSSLTDEQILLLVCEHTGKMINLPIWQLEQHIGFARALLAASPAKAEPDAIEAAELQTLLMDEFACYRPTHPAGLMEWARIALLDNSPHNRVDSVSDDKRDAEQRTDCAWRDGCMCLKESGCPSESCRYFIAATPPQPKPTNTDGLTGVEADLAQVQWRNIQKVVKEVADFCFGGHDHLGSVSLAAAHCAVVTSLTAKDGINVQLEPLTIKDTQ